MNNLVKKCLDQYHRFTGLRVEAQEHPPKCILSHIYLSNSSKTCQVCIQKVLTITTPCTKGTDIWLLLCIETHFFYFQVQNYQIQIPMCIETYQRLNIIKTFSLQKVTDTVTWNRENACVHEWIHHVYWDIGKISSLGYPAWQLRICQYNHDEPPNRWQKVHCNSHPRSISGVQGSILVELHK